MKVLRSIWKWWHECWKWDYNVYGNIDSHLWANKMETYGGLSEKR